MKRLIWWLLALTILAVSCDENTSDPVVNGGDLPASIKALYEQEPEPGNCFEGIINQTQKNMALARINELRQILGLSLLTYNSSNDLETQKSAFMCAINKSISHFPPVTWKCFSNEGATGCAEGNLFIGSSTQVAPWNSTDIVDAWIIDTGVEELGHRRWLFNPFLKEISFGRADVVLDNNHYVAATAQIFDKDKSFTTGNSDFGYVAYPHGNFPSKAFKLDWFLSFSVIANPNNFNDNKAEYGSVSVTMFDSNNSQVSVGNISFQTNFGSFVGIGNHLQWKASNLKTNEIYMVKINGVKVGNDIRNYQYSFKLVD